MHATKEIGIDHRRPKAGPRSRRLWLFRGLALFASLGVAYFAADFGLSVWELHVRPPLIQQMLAPRQKPHREQYACSNIKIHPACQPVPKVDADHWGLYTMDGSAKQVPLSQLSETPWAFHYRYNQFGLRDRDYDPHPAPGVVRVLGLGDSFAFGQCVMDDETLFRQLAARLGPQFEVLNGAQCGYYTIDELRAAQQLVPIYHPQAMLVVWLPNDISLDPDLEREFQRLVAQKLALAQKSARLWRLLGGGRRALQHDLNNYYIDCYDPARNPAGLDLLKKCFGAFSTAPDCTVAFALYPLLDVSLMDNYQFADLHRRVADMIRQNGMPVLDLAPAFAGQRASDLWVHDGDRHPNARANAIAARAIADWIHGGGWKALPTPK